MHFLITRPEADAADLKRELEACGHDASVDALLTIEPIPLERGAFSGLQAILATSRNALLSLGTSGELAAALALPLYAVGPATAKLARGMGFARVSKGAGTARDLVALITAERKSADGPLVHLAAETVAFDLKGALAEHGFEVRHVAAYRTLPAQTLDPLTARLLSRGDLDAVILMSPRTAKTFVQLVEAAGLTETARGLTFLCLSANVADALQGLGGARIEVAEEPNSAALLAAAARLAGHSPAV